MTTWNEKSEHSINWLARHARSIQQKQLVQLHDIIGFMNGLICMTIVQSQCHVVQLNQSEVQMRARTQTAYFKGIA